MIRARRKELGLRQTDVAAQIMGPENKPIAQTHVAVLERGFLPPRPYLIEQFARVLRMDSDLLYLAVNIVPPDVAAAMARLTPEEQRHVWDAFEELVNQEVAAKEAPKRAKPARERGVERRRS
jgi:transcriptional regulator with XRE-family HTH domain